MKKDIYITVTQAAEAMGIIKGETKELADQGILKKYKAYRGDTRYLLSMREVNLLRDKRIKNK